MAGFLDQYAILQQNSWNGRKIYSAQERESGQVVHLVAEAGRGSLDPYRHAGLPALSQVGVEDQVRWLVGPTPSGEALEDLWGQGALTSAEVVSMLLTVLDALASLSRLDPPLIPGYLDPAVIRRDPSGRWTLDYLSLAHAPEARASGGAPLGVYPMGTLLYWLATGQATRRTRVQVVKLDHHVPAQLQFIIIRALGRSYPSLAELRAALERAGSAWDFAIVKKSAPDPGLVQRRPPVVGEWALPVRPLEGFRSYVVPPPPDPRTQRWTRWATSGVKVVAALAVVGLAVGLMLERQPPKRLPSMAVSSAQLGTEVPPEPTRPPAVGGPDTNGVATDPVVVDPQTGERVTPPPGPAPGSIEFMDREAGGSPMFVIRNGQGVGWIYTWKMAHDHWVSLEAYNRLTGQTLYWTKGVGGTLRLYDDSGHSFVTFDFDLIGERIWLQLTLELQRDLGIQVDDTTPGIIRITSAQ